MKRYFKKESEEFRGDKNESWGTVTTYFETDEDGRPLRKIQVYANGNRLKYSPDKSYDGYGSLGEHNLKLEMFIAFEIANESFEIEWGRAKLTVEHQEIIDLVSNYLANHYSQRFGQALFNLGVNVFADRAEPANKNYALRDIYNDSDEAIRDRIKEQLKRFNKG